MSEEFDPYRQWLGIAPSGGPIDHYRLLGLKRFESDPAIIAAAADRQMLTIRRHQTGPRGAATQKVLNEISNAKLCLLNTAARTAYDEMLKGLAAATSAEQSRQKPAAPPRPQTATPTVHVGTERGRRQHPSRPYYLQAWFPLAAMFAMAAIAFTVWAAGKAIGRPSPADPSAGQPNSPATTPETGQLRTDVPVRNRNSPDRSSSPFADQIVVQQEASGDINLSPALAVLRGNSLRLEFLALDEVLTGWQSEQDVASWRFVIRKLPAQGVFRANVTYDAPEGQSYLLSIDGDSVFGYTRSSSGFVTDELFVPLSTLGEHELTLRAVGAERLQLKSIALRFPDR